MTSALRTELMDIANRAAAYINRLNGECQTFEIEGATMTAVISYEAEIGEDPGDYWTAPAWWIERESSRVRALYDNEEGEEDPEAARWLENMLN